MLADVAQEIDEPLLDQPLGVVHHLRRRGAGIEVEETLHLIALPLQVFPDLLTGEERALAALAARVADQPRAAAHQDDGLVPVELEMPEQHQRHQVAELQAGCGGIEPAVHRAPLREVALEVLRSVVHEAAPPELREEIRHGAESYDTPQPLASARALH